MVVSADALHRHPEIIRAARDMLPNPGHVHHRDRETARRQGRHPLHHIPDLHQLRAGRRGIERSP
jgi:hypothetical protein